MPASINIHRIEKRFLILPEYLSSFLEDASRILVRQVFSDNKVSRTIYFNNDDCPLPWGYSLKARLYLPDFSSVISISPQDVYRVEIKTRGPSDIRNKIQEELPICEAVKFINGHLDAQVSGDMLRPYTADEYQRVHFLSRENGELLRLTVDWDMRYAYFEEGNSEARWTGNDDFARVEIKVAPEYETSNEYRRTLDLISGYLSFPVVSKRARASHLASILLDEKGSHLEKELRECEIEAKFLVNHPNPALLFLELKRHLQGEGTYMLARHYPYTKEEAGINYYWARRNGQQQKVEGMKIRFLGGTIKPVFKNSSLLLSDSFGLNCILERQEAKGKAVEFTFDTYNGIIQDAQSRLGNLEAIGYLFRLRRAFWPENKITGRVYHVSIDQCQSDDHRTIYQIEVEYTGRYSSRAGSESESELKPLIRAEVAELAQEVLSFCNKDGQHLIPFALTKFDWLSATNK